MIPTPRQPNRLQNFDYAGAGAYFVTVCTSQRQVLFGDIRNGKMKLNKYGEIVDRIWNELPDRFPNIRLDEFVIMPNHIHGIINIVGAPFMAPNGSDIAPRHDGITARNNAPNRQSQGVINRNTPGAINRNTLGAINRAPTLGDVVRTFKALCTKRIHEIRPFSAPIWQRNYHDHIIRDDQSLNQIGQYIQQNAAKWDMDENNPRNVADPACVGDAQ